MKDTGRRLLPRGAMTASELARRWDVHRSTIHRWVYDAKLTPSGRISGVLFFEPDEIRRFERTYEIKRIRRRKPQDPRGRMIATRDYLRRAIEIGCGRATCVHGGGLHVDALAEPCRQCELVLFALDAAGAAVQDLIELEARKGEKDAFRAGQETQGSQGQGEQEGAA